MRFKAFGVLGIALILALASGFQTQGEKNTFLSRKKWYMSFEITLTGSGTVRKELGGGAFSSRTWRVNRSAQGDLVLDLPMPDLFPSSVPPSEVIAEGGTGRFIGWIPAPLEDKDLEDMLSGKFTNPALNPGYVHLAYRVDDAEQLRGRGAGEGGLGDEDDVVDRTVKGSGTVYAAKSGFFTCDLKSMIFDVNPDCLVGYLSGTEKVNTRRTSNNPGDPGEKGQVDPDQILPKLTAGLKKKLSGLKLTLSGPITAVASERYVEDVAAAIGASETHFLDLGIKVTLSPSPPSKATLLISPSDSGEYQKWRPKPGLTEDEPGTTLGIRFEVVEKDVPENKKTKVVKFILRLAKVSRYQGVCMNWPAVPNPPDPDAPKEKPDLRFKKDLGSLGSDYALSDEFQTLTITGQAAERGSGSVPIESFDGAAIGEFVAEAQLEDGRVLNGVVKGNESQGKILIPDRDEGQSDIAKAWRKDKAGGLKDEDDEERVPAGDMEQGPGDGLTVWEEYRGFVQGGAWKDNCRPDRKDLFIDNRIGANAQDGINLFRSITSLIVHDKLLEGEHQSDRVINFRTRSDRHLVYQHCLILRSVPGIIGIAEGMSGVAWPGPPKNTAWVNVILGDSADRVFQITPNISYTRNNRSWFIAHELGHSIGIYHHGDRDPWLNATTMGVRWQWLFTSGGPVIAEGPGSGSDIRVVREQGLAPMTIPEIFFNSVPERVTILGMHSGQHSGDVDCVMRYRVAQAYEFVSQPGTRVWNNWGSEMPGGRLCNSPAGTLFNNPNHDPQSRYGGADKLRGDCAHQFVISDRWEIKKR